jgi:hypothetical protein
VDIGLLWYDDDKKADLDSKVRRAAEFYNNKHGAMPNICYVNMGATASPIWVDNIRVRPVINVLVNHFWIGMDTKNA